MQKYHKRVNCVTMRKIKIQIVNGTSVILGLHIKTKVQPTLEYTEVLHVLLAPSHSE